MAKPTVMTIPEWLAATDLGSAAIFFHHDRKRLMPIDQALASLVAAPGVYFEVEGCLYVLAACKGWLEAKGGKNSDNAARRRLAVNRLMKQTHRLLKWHRDPNWREAWDSFERQKAGGKSTELKGMHGAFAREGEKAKGVPRMGATMVGKGLNFDSAHPVYGKFTDAVERITDAANTTTKTDLDELTDEEYRQIEALLFEWKGKEMKNSAGETNFIVKELVYMDKDKRIESMLVPKNGKFYTAGGSLFSTASAPGKRMIYAVDEYGNFYAGAGEAGVMNHSSFNRGKGVVCAGEIQAHLGLPLFLSNGSGHYRPGTPHLRNAVEQLKSFGISVKSMRVYDFQSKLAYLTGDAFILRRPVNGADERFNAQGSPLI